MNYGVHTFDFLLGIAASVLHLFFTLGQLFLVFFSHLLHGHLETQPGRFQHLDLTSQLVQFLFLQNNKKQESQSQETKEFFIFF